MLGDSLGAAAHDARSRSGSVNPDERTDNIYGENIREGVPASRMNRCSTVPSSTCFAAALTTPRAAPRPVAMTLPSPLPTPAPVSADPSHWTVDDVASWLASFGCDRHSRS